MFLIFIQSILLISLFFICIIGIAIGLYYAIRYIEEHTYAAKHKIEMIIKCIMILHIFPIFRGIGKILVLYSLIIQLIFYNLLEMYPDIHPSNLQFILGSVMALGNHFLFLKNSIEKNVYILEILFYFVVFVWVTPFCFFMSLSANDDTLPVQGKKRETWIGNFVKNVFKKVDKMK